MRKVEVTYTQEVLQVCRETFEIPDHIDIDNESEVAQYIQEECYTAQYEIESEEIQENLIDLTILGEVTEVE